MNKLALIVVGVLAVFMVKAAFLIAPTITAQNSWIFVGAIVMVGLAVQNYSMRQKDQDLRSNLANTLRAQTQRTAVVGVDLKLELILRTILKNEGKIQAIKRLRDETQMGLKEASEFISELEAS